MDRPFKTLESKETRAQRKKTVRHNSAFAAHRLMPDRDFKIDIRHFPFSGLGERTHLARFRTLRRKSSFHKVEEKFDTDAELTRWKHVLPYPHDHRNAHLQNQIRQARRISQDIRIESPARARKDRDENSRSVSLDRR